MAKGNRSSLPRALSNEQIPVKDPFMKTSMSLERGKLTDKRLARDVIEQLVLSEFNDTTPERQQQLVEASGLDGLSQRAEKAIHAVQLLLSDRDYKGDIPSTNGPKIIVTQSEYLEAYGITDFKGQAPQDAIDALIEDLSERQTLLFFKLDKKGTRRGIKFEGPLVTTIKVSSIEALPPEEAAHLRDRDFGSKTLLIISPTEIFTEGMDRLILFKPRDFYKVLEKVCGHRRPQCIDRFCSFLLTTSHNPLYVLESTLVERLSLTKEWNARKKERVRGNITKAIEAAVTVGYLERWSLEEGLDPKYTFIPNKEKIRMAKAVKPPILAEKNGPEA